MNSYWEQQNCQEGVGVIISMHFVLSQVVDCMPLIQLVRRKCKEEKDRCPSTQTSDFVSSHAVAIIIYTHKEDKMKKKIWYRLYTAFSKELANSCPLQKASLGLCLKEKLSYSFFFF